MGYIEVYGAVHMVTCGNGNGKGVVTNWVWCPIAVATAKEKSRFFKLQRVQS